MKRVVIPGELITKNKDLKVITGAYKTENGIYSLYLGVVYENEIGVKVVPLKGKYSPKIGDLIIGKVIADDPFLYIIDFNSYKYTILPKRDLDVVLNKNDVVLLRVIDINEIKDIHVEFVNKLQRGILLKINPKKVARVIGKNKSMLNVIQKYTNTKLFVGANGYVYVTGDDVDLVDKILNLIDEYSHVNNLTDKIENYLKNRE